MLTDRALVLRRYPWSESSLVTRVLTREHGRVHILARGAFRPRSRFFALLDLFDTLELHWSESPRRELGELREGELLVRRRAVTGSLERYRAGVSMLELCDLGSHPGQADPGLFDLLEGALDRLADGSIPPSRTLVVFELGFLQNHGLAPALLRCAACGGLAPPSQARASETVQRAAFSASSGGRLCAGCAESARASGRRVGTMPIDVLEAAETLIRDSILLRDSPRQNPETMATTAAQIADPDLLLRVRDFAERFLAIHLEGRPRTHREFLAAPNRNARPQT